VGIAPRNFPLPRGDLSHTIDTFLLNYLVTAATKVTSAPGNFCQIGLYNNASDGSFLHCVDLDAWCSDATAGLTLYLVNATPASVTITPGISVNPLSPQQPGQLLSTVNGLVPAGAEAIWRLGGGGVPDSWNGDGPLAILPAGWALFLQPDTANNTISAGYRWIVVHPANTIGNR
jgi:hypothetical protein